MEKIYPLLLSSLVAIAWMLIANDQYTYQQESFIFGEINAFPLFAWASGLFAMYLISAHWINSFEGYFKRIFFFSLLYWLILIFLETIAYHFFEIRNLSTALYPGLILYNCIHAPLWMQVSYLLLGPLYFVIFSIIPNFSLQKTQGLSRK